MKSMARYDLDARLYLPLKVTRTIFNVSGILIGLAIVGIALWSKSTTSNAPSTAQATLLEQPRVSPALDERPATSPASFAQRRVCDGERAIACRHSDNAYWLYRLDR
jgi:hypothetical protein